MVIKKHKDSIFITYMILFFTLLESYQCFHPFSRSTHFVLDKKGFTFGEVKAERVLLLHFEGKKRSSQRVLMRKKWFNYFFLLKMTWKHKKIATFNGKFLRYGIRGCSGGGGGWADCIVQRAVGFWNSKKLKKKKPIKKDNVVLFVCFPVFPLWGNGNKKRTLVLFEITKMGWDPNPFVFDPKKERPVL